MSAVKYTVSEGMKYLIAANRAQLDGHDRYAAALIELAKPLFETHAPRQAQATESQLGSKLARHRLAADRSHAQ
jgi:hypothetical protein